jgi:hypothetical protein
MTVMKWFSRTPEKGAETLVWLAESDEMNVSNGCYYKDMQAGIPSEHAQNKEADKRLWEVSQEQIRH